MPIQLRLHKSTTYRIAMNVLRCCPCGFQSDKVSVITRAFLPETERLDVGPLANRQLVQKMASGFRQRSLDPVRKGTLYCLQQMVDGGRGVLRKNEEVDVFRHVHKRDQGVPVPLHCLVDALREHIEHHRSSVSNGKHL